MPFCASLCLHHQIKKGSGAVEVLWFSGFGFATGDLCKSQVFFFLGGCFFPEGDEVKKEKIKRT